MALESLLEDAFARGCGISRAHALRTPRYRELLAEATRVPNTTQSETAEMIYLGERLADRAYANLPHSIRKRAGQWSTMTSTERHQTLDLIMKKLTSREWARIRRQPLDPVKNVSEVLPAEYGSWSRGKVQPNCLGMSQMLLGFARATGADHLMVDTITQHDLFSEELFEQTTRKMIGLLRPHNADPGIARLISKLEVYRERSLQTLAQLTDLQAHHALLIRVGDEWVLVDPYLSRKYPVAVLSRGRVDVHGAIMKRPRRRWLVYGGRQRELDCAESIAALEETIGFYARRQEPASSFGFQQVTAEAASTLAWMGVDPHSRKRPTIKEMENVFWHLMTAGLMTRLQQRTWPRGNQRVTKTFQRRFDLQVKRAQCRKRERNAAIKRLIREICLIGMSVVYDAQADRSADHRRIEISHPALHLAVMTLNHIGHRTDRSTAELLRFDTSQWIVHDTLREVMQSDNRRLRRIAEGCLRQFQKYPHQIMPALLVEVEKRK